MTVGKVNNWENLGVQGDIKVDGVTITPDPNLYPGGAGAVGTLAYSANDPGVLLFKTASGWQKITLAPWA